MILETVVVGPLSENCYVVGCEQTNSGAIIDPGDNAAEIVRIVEKLMLDIKYILLTHGHIDHLAVLPELKIKFDARFLVHQNDVFLVEHASTQAAMFGLPDPGTPKPDQFLAEGDSVALGKLDIKILHTPGHSPGSLTFFVEDKLFVGDLIFCGSIGRTDLPGGNYEQLIQSVKNKIFPLPDTTAIFPGHGPATSVGIEKRHNPFFN